MSKFEKNFALAMVKAAAPIFKKRDIRMSFEAVSPEEIKEISRSAEVQSYREEIESRAAAQNKNDELTVIMETKETESRQVDA